MAKKRQVAALAVAVTLLAVGIAFGIQKPELVLPEKVSSSNKACQEIMRLGQKYQVQGIFPSEFAEGKCSLSRLDVAVAVQLLTERIADKAAKEGVQAVDTQDLSLLADLREELRGEMLLAQAKAFQTKYTELGTNLHALTKNITLSGGMTGVIQGSSGNKTQGAGSRDHVDAVGRADVVFNFKVGDSTQAVIDLEATGGEGIDQQGHVKNFSILNNVPLLPTNTVRFRTAFVEQSLLSDRLVFTVGKIALTDYFDLNNVANNETTQFLAGALVNNPLLGAPINGPGMRGTARFGENVTFSVGYGSGNTTAADFTPSSSDIVDNGFAIAELDCHHKVGGLEGSFRIYGDLDASSATLDNEGNPLTNKLRSGKAYGGGISVDQQLSSKLAIFGRYGRREKNAYQTYSAWSAGFQYAGVIPDRDEDLVAFGYSQIAAKAGPARVGTAQEKLLEAYYKIKATDQIAVSPHLQYLMNPTAQKELDNVFVAGMRVQVTF